MNKSRAIRLCLPILGALVVTSPALQSAEFTTNPVGFNKVVCLGGADTVVSVPFVRQPALEAKVQTSAVAAANRVQLTVAGNTSWTGDQFAGTHYVRFITGSRAGQWYDIVNNSSNTLMLDTAGDNLANNVAAEDRFILAPHWTLDSLFPPADQNNGPGSVIHRSASHNKPDRRTEVELPNLAEGTNLPAGPIFYLTDNGWHIEADGTPFAGSTIIPPNSSFVIRHYPGHSTTTFAPSGSVLMGPEVVTLATSANSLQDNEIAVTRPLPIALDAAELETAFVESLGHRPFQMRDSVMIYDNAQNAGKVNSATYYRFAGNWYRDIGMRDENPMANEEIVFRPGHGVIIRKFPADGASVVWSNQASY